MDRQCSSCGGFCKKSGCERENTKPKREWVGLTEYQRLKFADRFHISEVVIEAIEAKLKEKNI